MRGRQIAWRHEGGRFHREDAEARRWGVESESKVLTEEHQVFHNGFNGLNGFRQALGRIEKNQGAKESVESVNPLNPL
jgi:hypothetical protein